MTDYSQPRLHDVHLYRYDSTFHEWDHEASFRLWYVADMAAKALTTGNDATCRLVDTRLSARVSFYRGGKLVDGLPDGVTG